MFAKRLKIARKHIKMTQQEAAECLGLSTRSYQRYEAENGICEPPLSTLVTMADLFDVSIDWLLCRDEFLSKHADGFQTNLPTYPKSQKTRNSVRVQSADNDEN